MAKILTNKSGYTLIELIVSMALFAVLTTLVIGGFLSVGNMKARSAAMKESQQRLRVAIEMINRTLKEADTIELTEPAADEYDLKLYFNKAGLPASALRYQIKDKSLLFTSQCFYQISESESCFVGAWPSDGANLLGGTAGSVSQVELNQGDSLIEWYSPTTTDGIGMPPSIKIRLSGGIFVAGNSYFNDTFNIEDVIVLESIK